MTLLASRVDALAQRLEKVATSSATSSGPAMGIYAVCEACGVQGHTAVECYNAPSSIEHVNAYHTYTQPAQNNPHPTSYNQGWNTRPNPLYKNPNPHPQNPNQPPGFHNRAPYTPPPPPPEPTSHLESLMERFIVTQTTTNETLKENIQVLTSRVDSMAAHQKTMDTQIAQIAQQVSHLSRSQGQLPGQTEVNPRRQVNAISTVGAGLEESPVMVLQEVVPVSASAGTEGKEKNEGLSPIEETRHQPIDRTYHPRVPFPQRLAWSELVQLEPRFERFLEILRRIYATRPFLEALKSAPAQWKFLR